MRKQNSKSSLYWNCALWYHVRLYWWAGICMDMLWYLRDVSFVRSAELSRMHAIKYNKPKDPVQVYDGEIFKGNSRMRHIMGTNHFYCWYGSNYTNYGNQHNSRGLNKFTCWRTDVDDTRHELVIRVMDVVHELCDWRGSKYDISSPDTSIQWGKIHGCELTSHRTVVSKWPGEISVFLTI